ncbi:hypothetical protein D9M69_464380 [compost metagenome]
MASGQQVRCSAYRLREQDGPPGRQLPACGRPDQEAPGSHPGAGAAGDRLGRELRWPGRSAEDEGDLLERRRQGHDLPRGGHPCRAAGAGRGISLEHGRGCGRSQRRADEQVPGRWRAVDRRDQGRPAPAYPGLRNRPGGLWFLLQEQGRAPGSRRRDRLPAGADRHPGH